MTEYSIFWFRRDLRLEDNSALFHALQSGNLIIPLFIFDDEILAELPVSDARVGFIHKTLQEIDKQLKTIGSSLLCLKGKPIEIWKELIKTYRIKQVYINKDYEPYAIRRDQQVKELLHVHGIGLSAFKDQVIFEENEIVKQDGLPYTIFTPYKNRWLSQFEKRRPDPMPSVSYQDFANIDYRFPALEEIGFSPSAMKVKPYDLTKISQYTATRDYPSSDSTSYLGSHLRFGTVGIRKVCNQLTNENSGFLNELIWREFFMQILFHFPGVVYRNFHAKYDQIVWLNNAYDFEAWCSGRTGYPMVDAGMRQLNETGYMHNRVRMIAAGFLCKHLLIDWRWGEAYFAGKLLDYELSSNNGNWQWAAGTGCDAAPYFRIFNPMEQMKKFDRAQRYVRRWIPEYDTPGYPEPIIDHRFARERALRTYQKGIKH